MELKWNKQRCLLMAAVAIESIECFDRQFFLREVWWWKMISRNKSKNIEISVVEILLEAMLSLMQTTYPKFMLWKEACDEFEDITYLNVWVTKSMNSLHFLMKNVESWVKNLDNLLKPSKVNPWISENFIALNFSANKLSQIWLASCLSCCRVFL